MEELLQQGDRVKIKGSNEFGTITGFNGFEYRVYWNSTNDMRYEFVSRENLIRWCEMHQKEEFHTTDPYNADVNNENIWMWLCEDCEHERAMDI